MIAEIDAQALTSLYQAPVAVDHWTSTPTPDQRVNRWQFYREQEVGQVIEAIDQEKNVVINGYEQAGKSTLMVEVMYALAASDQPVFGFSTRPILPELPTGGENLNQVFNRLEILPNGQIVMIDNVDYLFRIFPSMKQHEFAGNYYQNPNDQVKFKNNALKLMQFLSTGNFQLIFSLHNDWPESWIDSELKSNWDNLVGKKVEWFNLNPFLEPEKAAAYLTLERGIVLPSIDESLRNEVLLTIPFNSLKRKSEAEILALFKS